MMPATATASATADTREASFTVATVPALPGGRRAGTESANRHGDPVRIPSDRLDGVGFLPPWPAAGWLAALQAQIGRRGLQVLFAGVLFAATAGLHLS